MMIRGILLFLVLTLPFQPGWAYRDKVAEWNEVTVRADVHGRPVVAKIKRNDGRLTFLLWETAGKVISVPAEEISDIEDPQLSSIRLRFGDFSYHPRRPIPKGVPPSKVPVEKIPYEYLHIEYGAPVCADNRCERSYVWFLFWEGAYQERWTHRVAAPGEFSLEMKEPGKLARPGGGTRELGQVQ